MTIGFYPTASTPLPESLLASIILSKLIDPLVPKLVELGYDRLTLTLDNVGCVSTCRREVTLRKNHDNAH